MEQLLRYINVFWYRLRSADWFLFIAVFILLLFGISAIYSVDLSLGQSLLQVKKQFFAMGVALVGFVLIMMSNYRLLRNYALAMYLMGIASLVGVLIFGETIRGATGWFSFGVFSFQPVEFMKVALIVSLAAYVQDRARRPFALRELLEMILITAVPVFLVLLQPDLGSAFILVGIWFCMTLLAGMRWIHFLVLFLFGAGVSFLSWFTFLAEYQKARLIAFVDPTYDPLGQGYNVAQAIIAIGSGGLFGRGLGFGSQSQLKFLPESQTDFIFAVIAEELGLIGVLVIVAAFMLVFYRLYRLSRMVNDDFSIMLLLGIASVFFLQFLVNAGMNLGMFPVTGIGLPLVSYGGSSLVFMMLLMGISQSVAVRIRRGSQR